MDIVRKILLDNTLYIIEFLIYLALDIRVIYTRENRDILSHSILCILFYFFLIFVGARNHSLVVNVTLRNANKK